MCGLTENHFSDIIVMYTYLRYDYAVVSGEKSTLFTPPYMYVAIFLGVPSAVQRKIIITQTR